MKLLLIEDEKSIKEALLELLRLEKYEVDHYEDGLLGIEAIKSNIYDVIILDIMIPKKSGFQVAKEARDYGIKTPILMLTAKDDIEDKVMGLDSGADDYLTKPFLTKELLARIRALGRRSINNKDKILFYGDISLDTNTSKLFCKVSKLDVRLSEKELRIMTYFLSNQNQIINKEQLATKIWGYEDNSEYNKVEVYISFTRKKLSFIKSSVEIRAVRGLGYELREKNI